MNNYSALQNSLQELKSKLIGLAVEASKKFTTFTLVEEMVELQAQFCYSESELAKYNNEILVNKCQLLLKKLTEHVKDLSEYGISDRKLMLLKQTIEDFHTCSFQHTLATESFVNDQVVLK